MSILKLKSIIIFFIGVGLVQPSSNNMKRKEGNDTNTPKYLRVSIAHWNINTNSADAERSFRLIETDGLAVFRAQPGFINYRLMRADSTKTIAVAKWESEELGKAGAEKYRAWMRSVGIMDFIKLETYSGKIVVDSENGY
jgi:heme-degrading monooxygenase HmoA